MPVLTPNYLIDVASRILAAFDAPEDKARLVAKHLVNADLRGVETHGVRMLTVYADSLRRGAVKADAEAEITRESESTALVNGNHGFGQVVCTQAMKLAIEKAKITGVCFVGVFNCSHAGCLADYPLMAAERGLVGLMVANTVPLVAPAGGAKAILGTNPISIAVPTGKPPPIVLDMATSAATWGALAIKHRRGEEIEAGLILDADGHPTLDPRRYFGPPPGAILPLASHKGYGLAVMADLLAGALTGTGCAGDVDWEGQGVAMIALDIGFFGDRQDFEERARRLRRTIKDCPRLSGVDEILMPGEREFRLEGQRRKEGVPIDDDDWADLRRLAGELGITI